jgi:toxin ParE1/3/4
VKVRFFPAAVRDLKELRAYIAADNPSAAGRVAARIDKAIALLAEMPAIGRPTPKRPTREWIIPGLPYLIAYRMEGDTIDILRVWHTSRRRRTEW